MGVLMSVLAIWGAILSTILAALRLSEFLRDKPCLKVWGSYGYGWHQHEPHYRPHVLLTAVNIGKRPVSITEVELQLSRGKRVPAVPPPDWTGGLPVKLVEGDALYFPVYPEDLQRAEQSHRRKVAQVVFFDAARREYRGPVDDEWRAYDDD